jgi:hypothetical protein
MPIHFIQPTEKNQSPRDKNAKKYSPQHKMSPFVKLNIRPQTQLERT